MVADISIAREDRNMSKQKQLNHVTPESVGISSNAIIRFLELAESKGLELHGFMLIRHGYICAQGYWRPYRQGLLHPVHSFGKSITSLAIGFAIQEGLLSLDDRIIKFFPYIRIGKGNEAISEATIRDLLMMASGHETEPSMEGEDWIDTFFSHPVKYRPGTMFQYNTAGTNLLCAVLKRVTGMNLSDYLKERLFVPLGITNYRIDKAEDGTEKGGSGFRLTMEDMAKIMVFIMQKGMVGNNRLLNKEFFDEATVKQISTDNSIFNNKSTDSIQGYGYQFWMCAPANAYRAAGMFGQYGVVVPDKDLLLITTAAVSATQDLLKLFWDEIYTNTADEPLEESVNDRKCLQDMLDKLTLYPYAVREAFRISADSLLFQDKIYRGNEKTLLGLKTLDLLTSDMGLDASCNVLISKEKDVPIHHIKFIREAEHIKLLLYTLQGDESIPIGMDGNYIEGILFDKKIAAAGVLRSKNVLEVELRALEGLKGKRYIFTFEERGVWILSEDTFPLTFGKMIFMEAENHDTD